MVITVISHGFDCTGFCYQLKEEGNTIYIWVETNYRALEGVDKIYVFHQKDIKLENFIEKYGKTPLIIFDGSEFGVLQENLRKQGKKVLGSSRFGELIERNRLAGYEIAKKLGIRVPEYRVFETIEGLIQFLEKNPGKYVLKQTGNMPKTFNFIGDSEEMILHIRSFHRRFRKLIEEGKLKISGIVLQEYIEGYEVATAAFYTPTGWLKTENGRVLLEINFEHKKLCPLDIGPTTGEMGTVAWFSEGENRIFQEFLAPLEGLLSAYANWGVVDANCIVTPTGEIYLLEHTIRLGYPITELYQILLQEQIGISLTEFFLAIVSGATIPGVKKEGYGIVYVVAYPVFPYEKVKNKIDSYLYEYIKPPRGVKFAPGLISRGYGHWYISDPYGYAYTIQVFDTSLEKAQALGREALERIHPKSGAFYRPDIGDRVLEALKNEEVLRAITPL